MNDSGNIHNEEQKNIAKRKKDFSRQLGRVLRGDFLHETTKKINKYLIIFLLMAIGYISLKYEADTLAEKEIKLKEGNKRLRNKQVTLTFELIQASQQSKVEELLEKYGINLKAPTNPPYVIKVDKDGK